MNSRRTLTFGQAGQTLEFYPPEWPVGLPTSAATYAIYALDADLDDPAVLSGTATMDAVDTTFDAASGPSQASHRDRCFITSTANTKVGRLYVARTVDNQAELIQPKDIDDQGQYVTHQGLLDFDYAIGDSFKGFRQSFTVDPDWVADEGNISTSWRVRWTYTIDGAQYQRWTWADVARVSHHHNVTALDLYDTRPDLQLEQHAHAAKDFAGFINRAEKDVAMALRKFAVGWDQIRTDEADDLVRARAHWILAEEGFIPESGLSPEAYVEAKKQHYLAVLNNLKSRMELDKGTSGAATQRGTRTLWFGR